MQVYPVSFTARYSIKVGDSSGITRDQMLNEISSAEKSRDKGIDVPKYNISIDYQTKGETADFQNNKIEQKHLKKLFHNMFLMDKSNLSHNDLDIAHVFYSKDGEVEFDCFRFSAPFVVQSQKNYILPDFMMPSNEINYENASLGLYLQQFPNEEEKNEFLAQYLKASSEYHANRAAYIQQSNEENLTPEMQHYEKIQADVKKNPDENMTELFKMRLDFLTQQRTAFTLWDEGNGACGHEFSRKKRIDSIPLYLETVKSAIDYSQRAAYLAAEESDDEKAEYYQYESKFGEFFANTYLSWIEGMTAYNFRDERVCPLEKTEQNDLNLQYKKILDSRFESKPEAIDDYINLYNEKSK